MYPLEYMSPDFEIELFMKGFFSILVVALIIGFICWGVIVAILAFRKIVGR